MWERYTARRYGRWLKTLEGQRYMAAMGWRVEHGKFATLHELSPEVYAKWSIEGQEDPPSQPHVPAALLPPETPTP